MVATAPESTAGKAEASWFDRFLAGWDPGTGEAREAADAQPADTTIVDRRLGKPWTSRSPSSPTR